MSQEMLYLFGSILILLGLIVVQAASTVLVNGLPYGLGPRDHEGKEDVFSGRARRTVNNHIEGLVLFGFAILIVEASGLNSALTTLGAALYFWARLAYAPIYLLGVPVIRTIVWTVSLLGILIVLYACGAAAI